MKFHGRSCRATRPQAGRPKELRTASIAAPRRHRPWRSTSDAIFFQPRFCLIASLMPGWP